MLCALVPIIVIEALLIRRWLPLSHRDAMGGIAVANVMSTCVGVPLTWLLVALLFEGAIGPGMEAVGLQISWPPTGSPLAQMASVLRHVAWGPSYGPYPAWFLPTAATLLLVPCFFASVWLERWACLRLWKNHDPSMIRKGVFRVNLASYAFLLVMAGAWSVNALNVHRGK